MRTKPPRNKNSEQGAARCSAADPREASVQAANAVGPQSRCRVLAPPISRRASAMTAHRASPAGAQAARGRCPTASSSGASRPVTARWLPRSHWRETPALQGCQVLLRTSRRHPTLLRLARAPVPSCDCSAPGPDGRFAGSLPRLRSRFAPRRPQQSALLALLLAAGWANHLLLFTASRERRAVLVRHLSREQKAPGKADGSF